MNTDDENSEFLDANAEPGTHDGQVKPKSNVTLSFRPMI